MSEERELARADRALVDAIRADFQPEPLSPARAAAMRMDLERRLERRALARRFAAPVLATAALAAALWLTLPAAAPTPSATDTPATGAELDAYLDPDAFASELADDEDYLPADYQLLALLVDDLAADR
jgi:hypothetical protein